MRASIKQRFESYQDRSGGPNACWLWQGALRGGGYGSFWTGAKNEGAHRFAWEMENGPVPDGLVVAHLCNAKRCTNPAHLQPMPQLLNVHDAIRDGLCHPRALGVHCLAARCADGDEAAWRTFRRIGRGVTAVALNRFDRESLLDPDDVLGETITRILAAGGGALRAMSDISNRVLWAYVYRSAVNHVRDAARRREVRERPISEPLLFATPDAPGEILVGQVLSISKHLGTKRDRARDAAIFRAHYELGCSAAEIADRLSMNVKSVETVLLRLTAKVRAACLEAA